MWKILLFWKYPLGFRMEKTSFGSTVVRTPLWLALLTAMVFFCCGAYLAVSSFLAMLEGGIVRGEVWYFIIGVFGMFFPVYLIRDAYRKGKYGVKS